MSSLFFSFLTAFEDSVGVPNSSARRRVPQEVQLGARGDVFRDKELAVLRGGRSLQKGRSPGCLTVFSLATWLLLREG